MITLNELEKDFLKDIIETSKTSKNMFLGNFFDKYLQDIDVFLNFKEFEVEYRIDKAVYPNLNDCFDRLRNLSWTLMRLLKLLHYLEKHNYLHLFQESNPRNSERFGKLTVGNEFITYELCDTKIIRLLLNCSCRTIVVGQTLKDYVENDFSTDEQIRHNQNIKIAKQNLTIARDTLKKAENGIVLSEKSVRRSTIAIYVSIGLVCISIATSFYIAKEQSKNETKINIEQFDTLTSQLRMIKLNLTFVDSLLATKNIPDTINTRIINTIEIKNSRK